MNKLVVIGTVHAEGGACSSDALIEIIQKISPTVIFCEAAPEIFPAMLKATESFNTPEINALRTIIAVGGIEIVPIDLNDDRFDSRLEEMHELFLSRMKDYFYATEIQAGETYRLGFPYLNSEDCDQIRKDKNLTELMFVSRANHNELSKFHGAWLEWNNKRENHWIKLIHNYYNQNKFSVGVLLVGAAHRVRLHEKIRNLHSRGEFSLHWDFYPFRKREDTY